MHYFPPKPGVRSEAFRLAGATNGGSLVRSRPLSPFSSAEEMGLAAELFQVTSEAELEQFLGALFKKAWRGGTSFGGPAGDAIAEQLGSLVGRALEAEVAGTAATGRDLDSCRQLFEKYRQFVRLAGKAATAAASAPTAVDAIAAARKSLAHSANEKFTRTAASAGPAGNSSRGDSPRAAIRTAASAARAVEQKSRTGTPAPGGCSCSNCQQPPGFCQCRKKSRSGRWFRSGNSIIVNC
jgi:hypothetical protein